MARNEIQIGPGVVLLKPERREPAIVVLAVSGGRLAIAMRFARPYASALRRDGAQRDTRA